jgi:hypothetical protein
MDFFLENKSSSLFIWIVVEIFSDFFRIIGFLLIDKLVFISKKLFFFFIAFVSDKLFLFSLFSAFISSKMNFFVFSLKTGFW